MSKNEPPLDHEQARLAKLKALLDAGDEPYKLGFERSHTLGELVAKYSAIEPGTDTGDDVRVAGRIRTIRRHGKLLFADLQDSAGKVQLFVDAASLAERFEDFGELDIGDWAGAWGTVIATKRGELSVRIAGFEILSKCLHPLPEKWHGLKDVEIRYRHRYVDLITNPRSMEILLARSNAVASIRSWLQDRDFIEVETPMLQPIPGGALAKPFVTFHETLGMNLFLRIAPELYLKRLVVGGVEKVFEINRNFRNEGVSTQHNPEFTMLELYQAFGDYYTMAELLEGIVRVAAMAVRGTLKFEYQGRELDLESPFRRVRLVDLVREAGFDADVDGPSLMELYEKQIESTLFQPTFVMDFPREVSPLARRHRTDDGFTEHLDLVIGGIEIGPAYSELTDPIDQRARFAEQLRRRESGDQEAHLVDEDFLLALEYGMPPTGGLGLGIDRMVRILADVPSIREVILFPVLRPE